MSGSCTVGLCGPDPGRMDYCSQVGFPQFTLLIIWSNTVNSSGGLSHQEMGHIFSPKLLSILVCSFCIDILTPAWCAFMNVHNIYNVYYTWNMSSLYAYNINGIGGISFKDATPSSSQASHGISGIFPSNWICTNSKFSPICPNYSVGLFASLHHHYSPQ